MKVLVTYATVTGNTEIIAQAIAGAIEGSELRKLPSDVNPDDYDLIFSGFWCDKGHPDEVWQAFQEKAKHRPIAYFGTLGGRPESEGGRKFAQMAKEAFPAKELLSVRLWQGKIDPKVLAFMAKMPGAKPMTPERQARLDEAAKHPTLEDKEEAAAWAQGVLEEFKKLKQQ